MLLRGPQTPGELRTRTNRLCDFPDAEAVESTLKALMTREDGPFVARLARAPGARESRYTHLFFGAVESAPDPGDEPHPPAAGSAGSASLAQRVAELESSVAELRRELEALKTGG
jgi:uncharacterized protein YceH (UPF0502 family)